MKARISAALFAIISVIATAALAQDASTKDYTIIKLGNESIKNSEVMEIWKGLFPGGTPPDFNSFDENVRQNVLRGLVSERLVYREALKAGTDKSPEVKARLAALEKQVVMQTFMEKKAEALVTDAQLKAAYTKKAEAAKGQEEIRARHILVASEKEAEKLSERIKKGEDFDKLARTVSTDKGSGANGGELGWFTKDKMVPEFSEAAFKLKKNEVSGPVQSPFGWHVIQTLDRRAVKFATFETMRDDLKREIAGNAIQSYMEELLKKENIKYFGSDGKEKPFSISDPVQGAVKSK